MRVVAIFCSTKDPHVSIKMFNVPLATLWQVHVVKSSAEYPRCPVIKCSCPIFDHCDRAMARLVPQPRSCDHCHHHLNIDNIEMDQYCGRVIVTCETWRVNVQPGGKPGADVICCCNCTAAFQMMHQCTESHIYTTQNCCQGPIEVPAALLCAGCSCSLFV